MKDLLPIGSVVLLQEATKSLMIVGIMQIDDEGITYDYISCPFPEGYVNEETFFLFNHEDIAEVYFVGCINAESQSYIQSIKIEEFRRLQEEKQNGKSEN